MKALVCLWLVLPVVSLYCAPPAEKAATPEIPIGVVTVELDMSVEVTDADTGAPIQGATVTLVRSGNGKEWAPREVRDLHQAQATDGHGIARLNVAFAGNLCTCGWIEAYTGNSFVAVRAPNYSTSRAWISTPYGRLAIGDLERGKVAVQPLDTLRFDGTETRRRVSYHVILHRGKNA
jgi:hypothetical protein